ncbi:MAG: class I SAM-dependent methyltransferase [Thermoplasmatales archaeon]|nr:class I SAM-dependent methyltransferase [Thermoplasmatales archaeon]
MLNNNDLNINYSVQDAQRLAYNSNYFDFVISIDIIEHVPDSIKMIREINRVLKKNGQALITCPNYNFPFTYDPINRLLRLSKTKINFGAYGFGHYKLMNESELEKWFIENNFKIVSKRGLSKYLVGLLEMYWSGIMQKLLKENSLNQMSVKEKKIEIRPGLKEPPMLFITDLIIKIDKLLFSKSRKSIGLSYLLEKK